MNKRYKIILSGGGTGGHIYPAVAVAEALEKRLGDNVEILFVGAEGKMEMEKIPALGYNIKGLPVAGLQRKATLKNLQLPFKILKSLKKARNIIKDYRADIVVGFGGYASGPVLWSAQSMGLPTVIQEQNSYAGLTNKILSKRVKKICVAYEGMERFFPSDKIIRTGNPLRSNFSNVTTLKNEALDYFGLEEGKPIILILGGSLGTRTLNDMMKKWIEREKGNGKIQFIWQTGKFYEKEVDNFMSGKNISGLWRGAFINRMDYAYALADIVVSRSGASSVSELCLVGKPVIFVPSPNVAEDHQTKNAQALVEKGAALLVRDNEAAEKVMPMVMELLGDPKKLNKLTDNIKKLAHPDADERIVDEIIKILDNTSSK